VNRSRFEDELGTPHLSRDLPQEPEFLPISYPDDQFEGRWSAIQDRMEERPEEFEEPMER
jgi:hypothetical protein